MSFLETLLFTAVLFVASLSITSAIWSIL